MLDVDHRRMGGSPRGGPQRGGLYGGLRRRRCHFVTAAADGSIILWDADTGAQGEKLPGPPTGVGRWAACSSPTGTRCWITSSSDWAIYTWDTRPEHWIDVACAIAGRNLTETEWTETFPIARTARHARERAGRRGGRQVLDTTLTELRNRGVADCFIVYPTT